MKIGSIVECIDNTNPSDGSWDGCAIPKLNQPYILRGFNKSGKGIYLEEIFNPPHPCGNEYGYKTERFRELLPPMEIQDALDSCEPVLIELNN